MATILVADDDANNRLLVRYVAEAAGHTVLEAGDGAEALATCVAQRPHLLVCDLLMPAIGGSDLIRMLRKDARTGDMAIVLYTGTRMDAAMRDFMEIYRVAGVLTKPCDPVELMRTIDEALTSRPS